MLISEALEGKFVKSYRQGRRGIIQYAELRKDIHTKENVFAYAVKVRPEFTMGQIPKEDFWTTIYVGLDGEDN
jgi:hypothetical protein